MLLTSAILARVKRKVASMAMAIADSKAESCTASAPSNMALRAMLKKARLGLLTEIAMMRKAGEDEEDKVSDSGAGAVAAAAAAGVAAAAAGEAAPAGGGGRDMPVD